MENQDKNMQSDEQDMNQQSPAEKSTEEVLNEMEKESAETTSDETKKSFGELEEKAEGLLDKIGFGKKDKNKKEIAELKEKLEEMNDRYLRLIAEFDNYKKRNAKERMEWMKSAGQDVILSVLPTLDDFNRAMKQMQNSNDVTAVKEGVTLIYNKLKSTLETRGLKQLDSIGQDFNPEQHEAITEIPAPSEEMKGKVVDEIEKGFMLNDKMLRYAKVVVGK